MVKVKDAKCPNCGAPVQINDDLESTICQYCGTQIVIDNDKDKYNNEVSENTENDGNKSRNSKITKAKKHFRIKEFNEAKQILKTIVTEDTLDYEAYILLVKVNIELLEQTDFKPFSDEVQRDEDWNLYDELIREYRRAIKLCNSKNGEEIVLKDLGKYKKNMEYYLKIDKKFGEKQKILDKYVEKLNETMDKFKTDALKQGEYKIVEKYFTISSYRTRYGAYGASYWDNYIFASFDSFTRNGILRGHFVKTSNNYSNNPQTEDLYRINAEPITSMDEIKSRMDHIEEDTKEYVKKVNKNINSNNRKRKRKKIVKTIALIYGLIMLAVSIGIFIFAITSSKDTSGSGAAIVPFILGIILVKKNTIGSIKSIYGPDELLDESKF